MKNYIILICILLCSIKSEQSSQNTEAKLHEYLFSCSKENCSNYNPILRPLKDSSKKLVVNVKIGIKRIFEMDEANHKVTLFAVLFKEWKDEFLQWDPKDFDGITYTFVDYSKIWTPYLRLINSPTEQNSKPTDESFHEVYDNFPVRLSYNGEVKFVPRLHLTSECLFNYELFPFDTQYCIFYFQMPYDSSKITLNMTTYKTLDYYNYESIWSIEHLVEIPTNDEQNSLTNGFKIQIKRKSKNYLYTFPTYVIYILTLLMFMLPQNSNQRIIIGSICLIISTLTAYIMTDMFPTESVSSWPLLGKLYLFNTVLITFSLVFSALIITASRGDHVKTVPDWLKRLTINFLSKIFCLQAVAYTVFNAYNFKIHDEENAAFRENVNSQILMSTIDPDCTVRFRATQNTENETESLNQQNGQPENENIANSPGNSGVSNEQTQNISQNRTQEFTKVLKKIYNQMDQLKYRMQRDTYRRCINNEWMLVGTLVDKILFFVYCGVVLFSTRSIFKQ